jgi:hypothetical protein
MIVTKEKVSLVVRYHVQEVYKNAKNTKKSSLHDLSFKKRTEK